MSFPKGYIFENAKSSTIGSLESESKFQIEERLDKGSCGVVYRVNHLKTNEM